jgi:hypothetical protein
MPILQDETPKSEGEALQDEFENLTVKPDSEKTAADLLGQCRILLDELEQFERYLVNHKKDRGVELRHFKNSVKSEQKSLEKVRCLTLININLT